MKEVHYFSLNFASGEAWYRSQFDSAEPEQRCGEITPYYLFHPQAAARVREALPQAKLIVLLRDPVERALSQYFHSRRHGFEPLGLEHLKQNRNVPRAEAFAGCRWRHRVTGAHYLSRSRYEQQIPRWLATFSAQQLLVLRSEDLFEKPAVVWEQLLQFLDLKHSPIPHLRQPANSGRGEANQVSVDLRARLRFELNNTYRWAEAQHGLRWPSS